MRVALRRRPVSDWPAVDSPQALLFDVFGTVVDWRSSVAREAAAILPAGLDAGAFADAWRTRYQPAMEAVACLLLYTSHEVMLDGIILGPADPNRMWVLIVA